MWVLICSQGAVESQKLWCCGANRGSQALGGSSGLRWMQGRGWSLKIEDVFLFNPPADLLLFIVDKDHLCVANVTVRYTEQPWLEFHMDITVIMLDRHLCVCGGKIQGVQGWGWESDGWLLLMQDPNFLPMAWAFTWMWMMVTSAQPLYRLVMGNPRSLGSQIWYWCM